MTIPPEREPGVVVTLPEIYRKVLDTDDKVDRLASAVEEMVEEMVAVNKRLDQHHDRLNVHGERIRKAESQISAQWVVVSVMITAIGAVVVKFVTG